MYIVISPFSFLILFISVLSLLFVSLASRLSVLFTFSKNQLFVLLIYFCIVFWISILLISSVIFMISFLLLTLHFVCSSFSSCFRWYVILSIWDFYSFLRKACITINFPLGTSFLKSQISNGRVLIIICQLWSEKLLEIISVLLNLLRLVLCPLCDWSLKMFHVHLRRMYILIFLDMVSWKCQWSLAFLLCLLCGSGSSSVCSRRSGSSNRWCLVAVPSFFPNFEVTGSSGGACSQTPSCGGPHPPSGFWDECCGFFPSTPQ